MYNDDDFLQLSGLQHYLFCPRQWALIHIENQWQENLRTVDGQLMHKNVHQEGSTEKRGDKLTVRGMRKRPDFPSMAWRGLPPTSILTGWTI